MTMVPCGRARSASSRLSSPRSIFSAASSSPSACWECTRRKRSDDDMNPNLVALLYLVSGVLFILALRGLSSPDSSRRGNLFGMIGMAIAVLTTLGAHPPASPTSWGLVVGGIVVGGSIGDVIEQRVHSTSMTVLVTDFYELVG